MTAVPGVQTAASPAVTNPTPTGMTPAQIRTAYGFNQASETGAGETIAIVDAYDDPNLASDLAAFDQQFGLPAASLTKVNENGGSTLPAANANWALEISLDVEWAHAVAPGAKILLVEANSASLSDLLTAVNTARNAPGVATVSMSWGGPEFWGEWYYDSLFTTPAGHPGVTFVAASGDDGGVSGPQWPSVSPNVLSVGGTSLTTTSSGAYGSETAWSGSNGGISSYEYEPAYQNAVQGTGARTTPDVAYNADPNTGFAVYDSMTLQGQSGWFKVGGTSAGAPQWAGLIADIDQALGGAGPLNGVNQTLPDLYYLASVAPSTFFHQITSGNNAYFAAGPGYNAVTGLGTPIANALLSYAASQGSSSTSSAATTASTGSSPVVTTHTHTHTHTAVVQTPTTATAAVTIMPPPTSSSQAVLLLAPLFTPLQAFATVPPHAPASEATVSSPAVVPTAAARPVQPLMTPATGSGRVEPTGDPSLDSNPEPASQPIPDEGPAIEPVDPAEIAPLHLAPQRLPESDFELNLPVDEPAIPVEPMPVPASLSAEEWSLSKGETALSAAVAVALWAAWERWTGRDGRTRRRPLGAAVIGQSLDELRS